MKDNRTVDCNDQGAEFIQAQVDMTIQELVDLKMDDPKEMSKLLPFNIWAKEQVHDPILATQVTMFHCGGLALGVSLAHRIGDASTFITFLNQWAALSRRDTDVELFDMGNFTSSSLFPRRGLSPMEPGLATFEPMDNYVTKKLWFHESAILKMKAKATLNGKNNSRPLSKARLVSALLWKAFIGVDHASSGHHRDSALVQPINLRRKKVTNALANHVTQNIEEYSKVGSDNHETAQMISNSFSQLTNVQDTTNLIWLSSWCNFHFYGINFGFGEPITISFGTAPFKRGMMLLDDSKGNGVEAYVSMRGKDVPYFEQDEDIKAFFI
ncbi:Chloramphenicol acetyltransferase-like domain-containing protein [Artemisia annua]|uniref:Chloramphenicol acetyltransferase-like domain-containing protein n=1 Tax=Artemisia annua TaxID=35608 RepID=A0A2U1LCX8_ARTAN|nr:Chloramphenicol acetyltransferase-like domain-containing protein [Artemisia annua]